MNNYNKQNESSFADVKNSTINLQINSEINSNENFNFNSGNLDT